MKNIKINNIKNITIEDAIEVYKNLNISFIVKDGKLSKLKIF